MDGVDIDFLCEEIGAAGLLQNVAPFSSPDNVFNGFTGEVVSEGISIKLKVLLPVSFPVGLPIVLLENFEEVGLLPHINRYGQVCFEESEGIILDRTRPFDLVKWSILQALKEIAKGQRGENFDDFTEEFEVYWEELKGKRVLNFFNPSTEACEVTLFVNNKEEIEAIAETEHEILSFLRVKSLWKKTTIQKITYLPLPANTKVVPPKKGGFWSVQELIEIAGPALKLLTKKQKRVLLENSKSKHGKILFSIPRAGRGHSLFGIEYRSASGTHPLVSKDEEIYIKPITIEHLEKSYLIPRGGGRIDLSAKKVMLVGCGAIGGHIAFELIRAGITNLTLVDHDKFKVENTFRHVLGISKLNKNKALGLKEDLDSKYPYLITEAIERPIDELIKSEKVNLDKFDLIILAIGAPTVELWFNSLVISNGIKVPVIHTWLEPFGIGGHVLLKNPDSDGCFECLYSSKDEDFYLFNRASFAAPNQKFSTSLTGCNNLFTPYGSLDASQTAGLATHVALNYFSGKEDKSALYSWKGNSKEFTSNGFKLSSRFYLQEAELNSMKHSFINESCPVCSKLNA